MTEDEILAWLGRVQSPVRREGVLSTEEVAKAVPAYLLNGIQLFEEAWLLASKQKISRAASLAVLGLEEIAKIPLIVNTFLRYAHGVDKESWTAYWKSGGVHKRKQELIFAYGQIIRDHFDGDPLHERKLYRHYAPKDFFEHLDKQSSFYVDMRQDGVHSPENDNVTKYILDYILTFGQERIDSFCSWHITEQRTDDYLKLALGRNTSGNWTNNYSVPEVHADLLYQAVPLSASLVPGYETFHDFVSVYKKKASETHINQALIELAGLLRKRIDLSTEFPLYMSRYIGAFKLLIGLCEQKNTLETSFRRKLRGTLLPEKLNPSI